MRNGCLEGKQTTENAEAFPWGWELVKNSLGRCLLALPGIYLY
jgi:hypothetical protein